MTDNLFTLMYWALGTGFATGQWPGNANGLVTGASPRYRLYATKDGKMLAVGALEQKFWDTFCDIISLDSALRDDARDPRATAARVAEIVSSETAETWRQRVAGKDCCCSIVAAIDEALDDPHFVARGVFRHQLTDASGNAIPALPVPIDPAFRGDA
jgi:alpha-methylacyl-CoA racemase